VALRQDPHPSAPWLEFSAAGVAAAPSVEGVYRLLDEKKGFHATVGLDNLHEAFSGLLETPDKARFLFFGES